MLLMTVAMKQVNVTSLLLILGIACSATAVPYQFDCGYTGESIPWEYFCDGLVDCEDYSDEMYCDACEWYEFPCPFAGRCIPLYSFCDGNNDCGDLFDEQNCDINECDLNPNICENGACKNLVPGYRCVCNAGFEVDQSGHVCNDINECARDRQLCHPGQCDNTVGSFRCRCPKGYRVSSVTKACEDVDECEERPCVNAICHNTVGSFRCECFVPGTSLDATGRVCAENHDCPEFYTNCEGESPSVSCILDEYVCDDMNDCGNNWDETPTMCAERTCEPDQFPCFYQRGQCINSDAVCDGLFDCVGYSDEVMGNCVLWWSGQLQH